MSSLYVKNLEPQQVSSRKKRLNSPVESCKRTNYRQNTVLFKQRKGIIRIEVLPSSRLQVDLHCIDKAIFISSLELQEAASPEELGCSCHKLLKQPRRTLQLSLSECAHAVSPMKESGP